MNFRTKIVYFALQEKKNLKRKKRLKPNMFYLSVFVEKRQNNLPVWLS